MTGKQPNQSETKRTIASGISTTAANILTTVTYAVTTVTETLTTAVTTVTSALSKVSQATKQFLTVSSGSGLTERRQTREVLTPSEDDPRVSWIYNLTKDQLRKEMRKYSLDLEGTVEELRRRFARHWSSLPREQTLTAECNPPSITMDSAAANLDDNPRHGMRPPDTWHGNSRNVTHNQMEFGASGQKMELDRIKEIVGLPPNVDFETLCRSLANMTRSAFREKLGLVGSERDERLGHGATSNEWVNRFEVPTGGYAEYHVSSNANIVQSAPTRPSVLPIADWPVPKDNTRKLEEVSNLCNLVRKWNVKFDGRRDPVSFLERLEELISAYQVDRNDVLRALPELLTGTALLWYRNVKDSWRTFGDFRRSFDLQFLPPGYDRHLDEEIRRRTQGDTESFRDFVVALTTLMRRRGGFSLQNQLDVIYSNMKPDYKLTMKKYEIISLEQMISQAEHIEAYFRERTMFRPPPPPAMSLIPETAYHHKRRLDKGMDRQNLGLTLVERSSYEGSDRIETGTKGNPSSPHRAMKSNTGHPRREESQPVGRNRVTFQNSRLRTGDEREITGPREGTTRTNWICYNCERPGHRFRDCRLPRKLKCFFCKKEGVRTKDCSCNQGNATGARQTGASASSR